MCNVVKYREIQFKDRHMCKYYLDLGFTTCSDQRRKSSLLVLLALRDLQLLWTAFLQPISFWRHFNVRPCRLWTSMPLHLPEPQVESQTHPLSACRTDSDPVKIREREEGKTVKIHGALQWSVVQLRAGSRLCVCVIIAVLLLLCCNSLLICSSLQRQEWCVCVCVAHMHEYKTHTHTPWLTQNSKLKSKDEQLLIFFNSSFHWWRKKRKHSCKILQYQQVSPSN